MDGLLGVAGIIINGCYGSFPHSLHLAPDVEKNLYMEVS